jgi:hypothetical protein
MEAGSLFIVTKGKIAFMANLMLFSPSEIFYQLSAPLEGQYGNRQ